MSLSTLSDRNRVRYVQDRFLKTRTVADWLKTHKENDLIGEGMPSIRDIRRHLFPEYIVYFKEIISND